jgi:inorganic pyrophosphatase
MSTSNFNHKTPSVLELSSEPPEVEVVIEIPRGSFLKRGSTGHIDFISPFPCPLLDALILGPRLSLGTCIEVKAWGAVTLTDRGMMDDKLICSNHRPSLTECQSVLQFFRMYAKCKGILNIWRRRPGRNACDGWCEATEAIARAAPLPGSWEAPPVKF